MVFAEPHRARNIHPCNPDVAQLLIGHRVQVLHRFAVFGFACLLAAALGKVAAQIVNGAGEPAPFAGLMQVALSAGMARGEVTGMEHVL